jgi:hypothetical protein
MKASARTSARGWTEVEPDSVIVLLVAVGDGEAVGVVAGDVGVVGVGVGVGVPQPVRMMLSTSTPVNSTHQIGFFRFFMIYFPPDLSFLSIFSNNNSR